jgi:integrase
MIEALVVARHHGDTPDARLDTWLRGLPKSTLRKLTSIALIDTRYVTATTPLKKHVEDFEDWMRTTVSERYGRKRSPRYVNLLMQQLTVILRECGFRTWSDIHKAKVEMFLGRLREKVSQRTYNSYVSAIKTFCSWMADEVGRAAESPVAKVKMLRVKDARPRRGLDDDEVVRLVESTAKGPVRNHVSGFDRAVLYLVAIESGLRTRELQSLRVRDFDFDERKPEAFRTPAVRLGAEFAKNREPVEQALRRDRAEQLRAYLAGKGPDERALNVPPNNRTADMIRADLKAAGIEADDGKICFHSLRHTLATILDRSGVSLKTAMAIMRHSTRGHLTLGVYTDDVTLLEKRDATEKLPDYPWPVQERQSEERVA